MTDDFIANAIQRCISLYTILLGNALVQGVREFFPPKLASRQA
jgi:hypothetical protein